MTFILDTVPPNIVITGPPYGSYVNIPTATIQGTVDDAEARVWVGLIGLTEVSNNNGAFEGNVTLGEGVNNIQIRARDFAYNYDYVYHQIILDTIPPQLNITSPIEGAVTNTVNLVASGTVVDQNIGTVAVSANNGPPQALDADGSNFSGTIPLIAGPNALTFVAADRAGNISSITKNVLLDLNPPEVAITSPASGTQVNGMISVVADASDAESGISSVSLLIDGQVYSSTTSFPYTFEFDTITLSAGIHMLTVRATDRGGNQAEASTDIEVLRQIQLQITSPTNGAVVSQSPMLVKGIVTNNLREVGVVINGSIAQVNGDQFAGEIYLQEGQNTITVTATDGAGLEVSASISVTLAPASSSLSLTAIPASGIEPLEVTLEVETFLPNPVAAYQWDIDGNGTIDTSGATLSTITNTYPNPGLYFPMVIVIDTLNNQYEATAVVSVLSATTIDALLRAKWNEMKLALGQGDIEKALSYIASSSKVMYRYNLELMASFLSIIAQDMGNIALIDIGDNVAEYEMTATQDGQTFSFYVEFVKDEDGIWRIRFY